MIGQRNINNFIDQIIDQGNFPRSCIIEGNVGSGRKTLAKVIAEKLGTPIEILEDHKTDTIKRMIEDSYTIPEPLIYLIPDFDIAHVNAKNSVLKVIEEPPINARFILTVTNLENTPTTIRSRCQVFKLDPYTVEDLTEYCNRYDIDKSLLPKITSVCETFYDVDILVGYGVKEFFDFSEKVTQHLAKVSLANALKINHSISTKKDDGKYDLKLFLRAMNESWLDVYKKTSDPIYLNLIEVTSQWLAKASLVSANKSMIFDLWVIECKEVFSRGSE